jgi:hypothetical protein
MKIVVETQIVILEAKMAASAYKSTIEIWAIILNISAPLRSTNIQK